MRAVIASIASHLAQPQRLRPGERLRSHLPAKGLSGGIAGIKMDAAVDARYTGLLGCRAESRPLQDHVGLRRPRLERHRSRRLGVGGAERIAAGKAAQDLRGSGAERAVPRHVFREGGRGKRHRLLGHP
jgi:hypothetical protein